MQESCQIIGQRGEKIKKNYGCPKVQDLVDEENGICSSYSFRNKTTLHCSERNAKLFGDLIMHDLML